MWRPGSLHMQLTRSSVIGRASLPVTCIPAFAMLNQPLAAKVFCHGRSRDFLVHRRRHDPELPAALACLSSGRAGRPERDRGPFRREPLAARLARWSVSLSPLSSECARGARRCAWTGNGPVRRSRRTSVDAAGWRCSGDSCGSGPLPTKCLIRFAHCRRLSPRRGTAGDTPSRSGPARRGGTDVCHVRAFRSPIPRPARPGRSSGSGAADPIAPRPTPRPARPFARKAGFRPHRARPIAARRSRRPPLPPRDAPAGNA